MTEQKYVRSFFKDYWKVWVWFFAIGLIIGYIFSSQLKPHYEGAVTFSVSRKPDIEQSRAQFYVYDGYYNEQASVILRNNFAAWLTSPKTAYDIYSQSAVDVTHLSTDKLAGLFKVNDNPEVNTVSVAFSDKARDVTEKIGTRIVAYAAEIYPQVSNTVDLHSTTPLVVQVDPPRLLITLGLGLALVIASFFVTLFMHYLKHDNA